MTGPPSPWINYNGKFHPADIALVAASSRGLRYGDGLFETMLVRDGRIRLEDHHFDRFFAGMRLLAFAPPAHFTREYLRQQILDLCEKNDGHALSRARLMVFRGEGHLFDTTDNDPQYIIESSVLATNQLLLNKDGLGIGLYPGGCKACDPLANLKTNNFLLYAQAARYAYDHHWDDCMVLNSYQRIADSCIANLFCVRRGRICTPPLSEGCVGGVMRRFLLEHMPDWGFPVLEQAVSPEDLKDADEIFLTNALKGVRWVGEFAGKTRSPGIAGQLHSLIIKEA